MSSLARGKIPLTTLFIVVGLIGYPELESSYVREARAETSISGSNVYDATEIGGEIFFKVSHDNGSTFSSTISSHLGCNSSGILLSTDAEHVQAAQVIGNFNDAVILLDGMQILETDSSSSDLMINLGQGVKAVADTNDPGIGNVTFRWIDPNGPSVQTNEVPLSPEGVAEDQFLQRK